MTKANSAFGHSTSDFISSFAPRHSSFPAQEHPCPAILQNLKTIRSQILTELAAITAERKPTYSIDGQTFSWNDYRSRLLSDLREVDESDRRRGAVGRALAGVFAVGSAECGARSAECGVDSHALTPHSALRIPNSALLCTLTTELAMPDLDLNDDLAAADGHETVTITQAGTMEEQTVQNVLRRPVSLREIEASGGTFEFGDVKFHLPAEGLEFAPTTADTLTDSDDIDWDIRAVDLLAMGSRAIGSGAERACRKELESKL